MNLKDFYNKINSIDLKDIKKIDKIFNINSFYNMSKGLKIAFFTIVLLSVLLVFYLLFYRSEFIEIKRNNQAIVKAKEELKIEYKQIYQTKGIKEVNDQLESKLNDVLKQLPVNDNLTDLLEYLNNFAFYNQVRIIKFNPIEKKNIKKKVINRVKGRNKSKRKINDIDEVELFNINYYYIECTGEFDNIVKFLYAISKVDRVLILDQIKITSNNNDNKLKMSALINAYYQKKEENKSVITNKNRIKNQ